MTQSGNFWIYHPKLARNPVRYLENHKECACTSSSILKWVCICPLFSVTFVRSPFNATLWLAPSGVREQTGANCECISCSTPPKCSKCKKVKLSLCLTTYPSVKTYGGSEGVATRNLNLGIHGIEWPASRSGRFIPQAEVRTWFFSCYPLHCTVKYSIPRDWKITLTWILTK
jgi:hypothetical protein